MPTKYCFPLVNFYKQVLINEIAENILSNDFYIIVHSEKLNVVFENVLSGSEQSILGNVISAHNPNKNNTDRFCAMNSDMSNTISNVFVTTTEFNSDYFDHEKMCKMEWFYTGLHQGGNISTQILMNDSYNIMSCNDSNVPQDTPRDYHGFNIVTIPKGINNIKLQHKSLNGQISSIKNVRLLIQDIF